MIGVNLIPDSVVRSHRRSRRIRHWIVVGAVAAGLVVVPVGWQLRREAKAAELSNQKHSRDSELAAVKADLAEINRFINHLDERIDRANALRTKRSWAGLLLLLVDCMPERVWLASLATEGPRVGMSSRGAAASKNALPLAPGHAGPVVTTLDGARSLKLAGYAVEHETLYDFMDRLKQSQAFRHIELLKAEKEPVLWSEAVRFELTCEW